MKTGISEAGCDEAGRGCLAGPVFAAAVIIPEGTELPGLNDSKQLGETSRNSLRILIESTCMWSVARVEPAEIDRINILNASILAMHRALDGLAVKAEHILVDGNRFKPYADIPHTTVVQGDGKYMSIAAASILAKTHRDQLMQELALEYPQYGWQKNKGYPTAEHRDAIRMHGPSPVHRMSFTLLHAQISLF